MDREAYHAAIHGAAKSQTQLSNWIELNWTWDNFVRTITSNHWLCLREAKAIAMNGVWKNLYPQYVHDFPGFEKVEEESQEVFHNLVTFSEKVKLDRQEDFIKLLAVKHEKLTNEDLMEMETQRKDKESQEEEVTEEPKNSRCRKWQGDFLYLRRHC